MAGLAARKRPEHKSYSSPLGVPSLAGPWQLVCCSFLLSAAAGAPGEAQPEDVEESQHQRELVPVLSRERCDLALYHRAGQRPAAFPLQGESPLLRLRPEEGAPHRGTVQAQGWLVLRRPKRGE